MKTRTPRTIALCFLSFVIGALSYFARSPDHSSTWSVGYLWGIVLASVLIGVALDKVLPGNKQ